MFRHLNTALRALPFWPRQAKTKLPPKSSAVPVYGRTAGLQPRRAPGSKAPLASISDDGRAMVIDNDGFAASLIGGGWFDGLYFPVDELKDDFYPVPDTEALAFAPR